jgi:hypothetical protein
MTIYLLTDRLHDGRTVRVQADDIAPTVASWLAELGACSPLVELLSQAVRDGDWPATHGIADYLSVEVQVAAGHRARSRSDFRRHTPSTRRHRR